MSLDYLDLTEEESRKSEDLLREANINISLRRVNNAINYLNKDLEFRHSIQKERNRRIHKGEAYYNIGICYLFEENYDLDRAVYHILLAYIEDLITNSPHIEIAELGDAARILRISLDIDPKILTHIGIVLDIDDPGDPTLDPVEFLSRAISEYNKACSASLDKMYLSEKCKSNVRIPRKAESPECLNWDKRVFIGGNYATQTANLLKIKEIVMRLGFKPLIVDDYLIPEDKIRFFSLMLLHLCKFAIFDITVAGGQYFEIERTRDYGIKPLLFFNADSKERNRPLTSGTKMIGLSEENIRAYKDMETDLKPIIREYLLGSQAHE